MQRLSISYFFDPAVSSKKDSRYKQKNKTKSKKNDKSINDVMIFL
jgi:hypothetical protein